MTAGVDTLHYQTDSTDAIQFISFESKKQTKSKSFTVDGFFDYFDGLNLHVKMTKMVRRSRSTARSHLGDTRATTGGMRISAGTQNWRAKVMKMPKQYSSFTAWYILETVNREAEMSQKRL